MKRKVVRHGASTLIVSLPNKWVKQFGVIQGQELDVQEDGRRLIVSTESNTQNLEISQDITGLDRTTIMYVIRGYYRQGFSTIHLTFKDSKASHFRTNKQLSILEIIHKEVSRLIGFEVLEEGIHRCTITDLQGINHSEFEHIQRRVFLLINHAAEDLFEGMKQSNLDLLASIEEKHDTITKFASYCIRLINRGACPSEHVPYLLHVVALLDRITDCMKYSARLLIQAPHVQKETLEIMQGVVNGLRDYYKLFYAYDNALLIQINKQRYLSEQILESMQLTNAKELIAITEIHLIQELLLDLVEARSALGKNSRKP